MLLLVHTKVGLLGEGGWAYRASIRSLSRVEAYVGPQTRLLCEVFPTLRARVGFLLSVATLMSLQVTMSSEAATTLHAHIGAGPGVGTHVNSEHAVLGEDSIADGTGVGLGSCVRCTVRV